MIDHSQLIEIGELVKPHGVKGELTLTLHEPDIQLADLRCIFIDRDGLPVPFFIDSVRNRSTLARLVHIDGITTEQEAKKLSATPVFALKEEVDAMMQANLDDDEDGVYANDLIGLEARYDGKTLGKVTAIDDSTQNLLLVIEPLEQGDQRVKPLLVPLAGEFITAIDDENGILELDIPEGLLEL